MLSVEGLEAAYGDSKVLFGVDFTVAAGEVVALLGRNGMGKTTTVRSVFGLLKPRAGRILLDGADMTGRPPHDIARRGLGLVPEGRQVFPTLTVEENLIATARHAGRGAKWTLASVYGLFPGLAERRRHKGNQLSGGEQQMLAIGRALMTNPRLIAILVIDKNVDALARLADRHIVMEKGRIAWTGTMQDLLANADVKNRYLHV
jgi:branched-chain amino acid transport system ATP-binding protein